MVLSQLVSGGDLSREQAKWALREIMSGEANEAQMGAFMMALRTKGETVEELSGLVDVMLENALVLETGNEAVDIVGTGGDLVGTVNISSMASIVASCTVPVLKHGSRSASGKTGSSEMLEVLGIRLDLSADQVAAVFGEVGITFFFAPVFHPAMRHVAPVRRALGVPTTFNFLGPLANPAQPIATALGVANKEIAPLMAQEMAARGRTALVFRSEDGLDELSTTAQNDIWQVSNGKVDHYSFDATGLGIARVKLEELLGGDAQHNAMVAKKLFANEALPNRESIENVVALNAAAGIVSYDLAKETSNANQDLSSRLSSEFEQALESIKSGAAAAKLEAWSAATQKA